MNKIINIAKDFSDIPGGRFLDDGDYSGQLFRDAFLVPALNKYTCTEVIFDHTEGFGSSFLEEAFGGLVRVCKFDKQFLDSHLRLVAKTKVGARYKMLAGQFISAALERT